MHAYKIDGQVKRTFTNTYKKEAKALPFDTNEVCSQPFSCLSTLVFVNLVFMSTVVTVVMPAVYGEEEACSCPRLGLGDGRFRARGQRR